MRFLLAFILMCGVAAGVDLQDQSAKDIEYIDILLDAGYPQYAVPLIRNLRITGNPEWEKYYNRFREVRPHDEIELPGIVPLPDNPRMNQAMQEKIRSEYIAKRTQEMADLHAGEVAIGRQKGAEYAEYARRDADQAAEKEREKQKELMDREKRAEEEKTIKKKSLDRIKSLSESERRKLKNSITMATKTHAESELGGRCFVTPEFGESDDLSQFNFHLSYKINPRTEEQVYHDMCVVFSVLLDKFNQNSLDRARDDITLRARAFMPLGTTVNEEGMETKFIRFGKCHALPNDAAPRYNSNWFDWTDGE